MDKRRIYILVVGLFVVSFFVSVAYGATGLYYNQRGISTLDLERQRITDYKGSLAVPSGHGRVNSPFTLPDLYSNIKHCTIYVPKKVYGVRQASGNGRMVVGIETINRGVRRVNAETIAKLMMLTPKKATQTFLVPRLGVKQSYSMNLTFEVTPSESRGKLKALLFSDFQNQVKEYSENNNRVESPVLSCKTVEV